MTSALELVSAPIASLLGMQLDEADVGRTVFSIVARREHENPMGTMHGGVLATLVDTAMGCAVLSALPPDKGFTTLELKTNYVRAATVATGRLRAEGRVVHLGGRTATTEARVTDDDGALYAHATSTCLIVARTAERRGAGIPRSGEGRARAASAAGQRAGIEKRES